MDAVLASLRLWHGNEDQRDGVGSWIVETRRPDGRFARFVQTDLPAKGGAPEGSQPGSIAGVNNHMNEARWHAGYPATTRLPATADFPSSLLSAVPPTPLV